MRVYKDIEPSIWDIFSHRCKWIDDENESEKLKSVFSDFGSGFSGVY